MRTGLIGSLLAILAIGLLGVTVYAASPSLVNYQGRLTTAAGMPVADGSYSVVFTIYDAFVGGNAKWTETQTVTTSSGLFSVLLGSINPVRDTVFTVIGNRWLGIKVGADPEMTPRTQIASVPYALATNNNFGWWDDGSVVRLYTSDDRVGIGTTSPKAPLHVTSTEGTAGYFEANGPGGGYDVGVVHAKYTGTGNVPAAAIAGSSVPQDGAGMGGWFEGGLKGVQAWVIQPGNNTYVGLDGWTDNSGAGDAYGVRGTALNGTGRRYGVYGSVTGSGAGYAVYGDAISNPNHFAGYFTKGNPGIVAATFKPVSVFENSADAYIALNSPNSYARGVLFGQPSSEQAGGIMYNDPFIPNSLCFLASAQIRMTISSMGYVGIGTFDPAAGLHVRGAGFPAAFGYFDTYAAGQDAGLRFEEAGVVKSHLWHQANTNTLNLYGSGGSGLAITSTGDVGIGTTAPTAKLHVVGNICYTGSIGACSDARYKTDVQVLSGSLDKVLQLRGVSYRWKKEQYPNQNFDDRAHIGVIAQELERLFPELVMTDSAGYKSVDYSRLTPVLVEAIKQQQSEITTQQQTIASLTARLEKLEATFTKIADATNK